MKKHIFVVLCLSMAMLGMTACDSNTVEFKGDDAISFNTKRNAILQEHIAKSLPPGTTLQDVERSLMYSFKGSEYFHKFDCIDLAEAKKAGKEVHAGNKLIIKATGKQPCPKCLPDYEEQTQPQ